MEHNARPGVPNFISENKKKISAEAIIIVLKNKVKREVKKNILLTKDTRKNF